MKKNLVTIVLCLFSAATSWFAYDAFEGPDLIPPVTKELPAKTMSFEPMAVSGGSWFQRVADLEEQVTTLQAKVSHGELYMDAVNTALKKYVFYIYGEFSEDPAENLQKMEKWVLDIRAEMKETRNRLSAVEGVEEELIFLSEQVTLLEEKVAALEKE